MCVFSVGVVGRFCKTSLREMNKGSNRDGIGRRRLTEDLSVRGVGSNAVNDREREFSFREVFSEPFIMCVLGREVLEEKDALMVG